ncbi:MAG TPA: hypothetical protein VN372_02305, partial [Methanospirillum sp.]|nr:hypothetical protein [Methanospirillum sp.]
DLSQNYNIIFLTEPDNGSYRDPVRCFGYISGGIPTNQQIVILLDTIPLVTTISDETGKFQISYEIGKISAGVHDLVAEWKGVHSHPQSLVVTAGNTTLGLTLKAVKDKPLVLISGILSGKKPVQTAPVQIKVNNETWKTVYTTDVGGYYSNLSLPEGTFFISTKFSDNNFPLHSSESTVYEVVSTGTSITSIGKSTPSRSQFHWYSILIVSITAVLAGAGLYLLRIRKNSWSRQEEKDEYSIMGPLADQNEMINPTNAQKFSISLPEGENQELVPNISEVAHLKYLEFLDLISVEFSKKYLRTLTPREVSSLISSSPYTDTIVSGVKLYEKIRYGGSQREEDLIALGRSVDEIQTLSGDYDRK